jgi:hypothetical protein
MRFHNSLVPTMGFFGNAFKALDQFGHNIPKYAEHAAPMITGAASVISQEAQRHAGYAARDFDWFVNNAGQEVIKNIDPNTLQGLGNFGEEVGKNLGATADDVWKALLGAHEEVGKHVGGALDNAKSFGWEAAAKAVKEWVVQHPELAVAIAAALAGSVAVMAVPPVLGALGFTEGGVVAGKPTKTQVSLRLLTKFRLYRCWHTGRSGQCRSW